MPSPTERRRACASWSLKGLLVVLAWFGVSALGAGTAAADDAEEDERTGGLLSELARVAEEDLAPVTDGVAQLIEPVTRPVTEHVVEPSAAVVESVGHEVVEPVIHDVAEPLVAPVRDEIVQPVLDTVAPVVDATVAPLADEVVTPVIDDVVAPVIDPLTAPIVDPLVESLAPTLGPVDDVLHPDVDRPADPPTPTVPPTGQDPDAASTEPLDDDVREPTPSDGSAPSKDRSAAPAGHGPLAPAAAATVNDPITAGSSNATTPAEPDRAPRSAPPIPTATAATSSPTSSGDSGKTGDASAVLPHLRRADDSDVAWVAPGSDRLDRGVPPRPPVTPD